MLSQWRQSASDSDCIAPSITHVDHMLHGPHFLHFKIFLQNNFTFRPLVKRIVFLDPEGWRHDRRRRRNTFRHHKSWRQALRPDLVWQSMWRRCGTTSAPEILTPWILHCRRSGPEKITY